MWWLVGFSFQPVKSGSEKKIVHDRPTFWLNEEKLENRPQQMFYLPIRQLQLIQTMLVFPQPQPGRRLRYLW